MEKIIFLMGTILLFTLNSCQTEVSEANEVEVTYNVISPVVKDTNLTRDYVCQIHSSRHIELRALEKGYLQEIFVDEGQFVKKGQLMFQILPTLYKAEMKKAEAEANFAKIEYQNTKLLADSNIVSSNELALAEAKLQKAEAELALAKVHLGFTEIRAPFDGYMDRFNAREGSLLDEGELLTTISQNEKMWVYFNVPESEYLDYASNTKGNNDLKVDLQMANHKTFDHSGVIETIEADFNNETGNIAFRASFPNPNGLLRHGETGNILIDIPYNDALIIPQKATYEVLDKKYVYIVDKDNVLRSKEIQIAAELPHLYIISEGLTKDDNILLDGLNKVRNNEKVHVQALDANKVLAQLDLYAE